MSKQQVLSNPTKPKGKPVDRAALPPSILALVRFVAWIWQWSTKGPKWTKPPVSIVTSRPCDITDPTNWFSLDDAIEAVTQERCDGIGIVMGELEEGVILAGMDLDDCRDPETGELNEFATEIVVKMNTYTEVSPSGTGVKLLFFINSPLGAKTKNKAGTLEVYVRRRYFTLTGQRVDGTPPDVEHRQEEVAAIYDEYIRSEEPQSKTKRSLPLASGTDVDTANPALAAMLRHEPEEAENDGSNRLFRVCCRAVEHDQSDAEAIATVRQYEKKYPFPKEWTDEEIIKRIRSAEKKAERGKAFKVINASNQDLSVVTPLAWKALTLANDPVRLVRHGGLPSRIESSDQGEPIVQPLDAKRMRHELANAATWQASVNGSWKPIAPPMAVVNDVLATEKQPLPVLVRIVEAPVFAKDGTLQTETGYHEASQTYYRPVDGFVLPEVPENPTAQEIEEARDLLCEDLLGDFPFVGDAERAHAMALLLLPFVRDMISGPTPLHLIEKPSPGSGGTLCVMAIASVALGRPIAAMTEGSNEDEWRKRITAKLMDGPTIVLIDNLRDRLDSAALSSAITSTLWEDRILKLSEVTRLPVRCAWVATGNNPGVSTEIARRTVRIRLDPKTDRPWERTKFKHPDLMGWAFENRPKLVWAALTLIRAWIAAGQPTGEKSLGMFEGWARVMGGILKVAGIDGFLHNLGDFYEETDAEGADWRRFVLAWWKKYGQDETTVAQLHSEVEAESFLNLGNGSEHSQKVVLGTLLAGRKDRVFNLDSEPNRLALKQGKKRQGACTWHLALGV